VLARILDHLLIPFRRWENLGAILLAVFVGLAGGVGAIVFRALVEAARKLLFEGGGRALPWLGGAYVIVLPALGLVVVAFVIRHWAPETQGTGVPEVMFALRKQGGRIRPRVAAIKALTAALCIGSGGSVGREGPIVQIGAAVGSTVAQVLGLGSRQVRLLLACGAAAGVGGTFNAPMGGVIFAMEVILGNFGARSFGLVVISSVTATALCQAVLGAEPAFALQRVFALESYAELPIYLVLGLFAGAVALGYVQSVHGLEALLGRWRRHYLLKALLGGVGVGVIGYLGVRFLGGPYLFGVGYDGIEAALKLGQTAELDWGVAGRMSFSVLLILVVLKIAATALTLASGGSGGSIAPALFIGAMAGGAFGSLANALFPEITAPPGAYALVGMAAVFAGSAHAPLTAILTLFEMTDEYQIILPLMIAVVISHLIASAVKADSIFTLKLRRRGGMTRAKSEPSVLDLIVVADAMSTEFMTVDRHQPVDQLAAEFHGGHERSACVLDSQRRLIGIVTEYDVETALMEGGADDRTVGDIMTRNVTCCTPDQRLREVIAMTRQQDVGQLPVVAKDDRTRVLGVLRRTELFWAYGELASEHERMIHDSPVELPSAEGDLVQDELTVHAGTGFAFAKLKDLAFPKRSRVVVVRRGNRIELPTGDTVLEPGDVVLTVTVRGHEDELRRWIRETANGDDTGA
jgi:CIC family chloride channel protein